MRNPLWKRLPRELKSDFGKYIVIFLFMTLTIGFVSGFLVTDDSMLAAYDESFEKYNIEHGNFTLSSEASESTIKKIEEKGIKIANVTLHVGIGTFRPVKEENIEEHKMHTEHFYIKQEDVDKINETKKNGKKVIAVGTTSCRVLETVADENTGLVKQIESDTGIYIYPGYKFKCVDGLITNFHLPKSTLLMLVSALADREFILEAYNKAVEEKYRFFSFGDAMFIK